jgi:hypothetical protein
MVQTLLGGSQDMTRLLCFLGILSLSAAALPTEKDDVARAAATYLRKVSANAGGHEPKSLTVERSSNSDTWVAKEGFRYMVYSEAAAGIVLYGDAAVEARSQNGPNQANSTRPVSSQRLIDKARSALDLVGWYHGPDVSVKFANPGSTAGRVRRQIVGLTFSDMPYGYSAVGVGNFAFVGLDSATGEVASMQRQIGYRYEQVPVKVSKEQAIKIAVSEAGLSSTTTVQGPRYLQFAEKRVLSERARELKEKRTLALGYLVTGPEDTVYVAADTGEVLLSGSGPTAGARPNPTVQTSQPSPTKNASQVNPLLVLAIGGLVAVAAIGLSRFKHRL